MALSQRDVDDRRNELQPCLHPSTKTQWPLLKSACQKQTLLTVQWAVQCFDRGPNSAVRYSLCNFQLPPVFDFLPPPISPLPSPPESAPLPSGSPFEPGRDDLGSRLKVVWVAHCRTSHSFRCFRPGRRFRRRQFKVVVSKTEKKARSAKSRWTTSPLATTPPPTRRYRPRFTLFLALLYGCLIFILDLVVPLYPSSPLINRLASTFSLSLFFFFVHSLSTLFFSTTKVDHRLR